MVTCDIMAIVVICSALGLALCSGSSLSLKATCSKLPGLWWQGPKAYLGLTYIGCTPKGIMQQYASKRRSQKVLAKVSSKGMAFKAKKGSQKKGQGSSLSWHFQTFFLPSPFDLPPTCVGVALTRGQGQETHLREKLCEHRQEADHRRQR